MSFLILHTTYLYIDNLVHCKVAGIDIFHFGTDSQSSPFGYWYLKNMNKRNQEELHFYLCIRDWSLITGRGGLQNGKIAGPKLFAPPPQDRVKLFAPPLLKSGNFTRPPYNMAKTSSYHVKSTPKLFVPPPSEWRKLFPPPLFLGVKLHVPPPPVL